MQATFKPTNYTFRLDDNFFVEVVFSDGSKQACVAVFADLSDAVAFANLKLKGYKVRSVYVFSRTHQHFFKHNHEEVTPY